MGGLSAAAAVVVLTGLWGLPFRALSAADAPAKQLSPVVMTETFKQVESRMSGRSRP